MSFFTRSKTVESTPSADYPAPYGDPGAHFDFPYMVTDNDANSVTPVNADGTPMPFSYESVMPQSPETNPLWAGEYALGFLANPLPAPTYNPTNPAPGSVDLERPSDTPFFAPGTNRLIHSIGPVTGNGGSEGRWDGSRATIGRAPTGQGGPVTGGPDYAQQLALTFQAAQNIAYSQQAAASALVSAV